MKLPDSPRRAAIKRAELLSALGAGVLGAGLALLAPALLAPHAPWILLAGLVSHAVGMTLKYRLERDTRGALAWERWLFWGCWIVLVLLAVGVAVDVAAQPWPVRDVP